MKITLVRHTRVALPQGTCYGWSDVPVADSFEAEAKQTLQNLKAHEPFDAVFSSPLQRARQLAAFCGFPDATLDERLKEMNMGEWELQRYDDLPARDPYILEWYENYLTLPTPKGESFPQLYARVTNFLEEVARRPYNHIAIFAHGGVLACAAIYARAISPAEAFAHITPFGGIETIDIPPQRQ